MFSESVSLSVCQDGCRPLDGALEWQNETRTLLVKQDNGK